MKAALKPNVGNEVLTIGRHFAILFNSSQAVRLWGLSPSGDTGLSEIFILVTRLRLELGLDTSWSDLIPMLFIHNPDEPNTYPLQDDPRPPKNAREYQILVTQICGRLERIVLDKKALKALRREMRDDPDKACRIASTLYIMAQVAGELPGAPRLG